MAVRFVDEPLFGFLVNCRKNALRIILLESGSKLIRAIEVCKGDAHALVSRYIKVAEPRSIHLSIRQLALPI